MLQGTVGHPALLCATSLNKYMEVHAPATAGRHRHPVPANSSSAPLHYATSPMPHPLRQHTRSWSQVECFVLSTANAATPSMTFGLRAQAKHKMAMYASLAHGGQRSVCSSLVLTASAHTAQTGPRFPHRRACWQAAILADPCGTFESAPVLLSRGRSNPGETSSCGYPHGIGLAPIAGATHLPFSLAPPPPLQAYQPCGGSISTCSSPPMPVAPKPIADASLPPPALLDVASCHSAAAAPSAPSDAAPMPGRQP